jgi:hypothetical protein
MKIIALAAGTAALLTLAACGDDAAETNAPAETPPAATTTTPPAAEPATPPASEPAPATGGGTTTPQ